jgi:hypothetical protein
MTAFVAPRDALESLVYLRCLVVPDPRVQAVRMALRASKGLWDLKARRARRGTREIPVDKPVPQVQKDRGVTLDLRVLDP